MVGRAGFTWHSPVIITIDNSIYAMLETTIGFFYDGGGSYLLSHTKHQMIEYPVNEIPSYHWDEE